MNHEGDPNCKHEWVYSDYVLCAYPAVHPKICRLCGRVEHERDSLPEDETFRVLMERFHAQ